MKRVKHSISMRRNLSSGGARGQRVERIVRASAFVIGAFVGCVALASGQTASAADKVIITVDGAFPSIVPQSGIANGYFKEQGLEISTVKTRWSKAAINSAVAGKTQFGFATAIPLLAAVSRGAKIVAVGLLSHGFSGKFIASNANAHLKSLEDFKGKSIGAQRGTGVHTVFLLALKKLGLSESDFQIKNIRVADMPGAMQAGDLDAVVGWEPGMSRIVDAGYGKLVITNKSFEKMTGTTYPFLLFTTQEMIDTKPDVVQRFLNGWAKSQEFAWKNRAGAMTVIRDYLGDAIKKFDDKQVAKLMYIYEYDRTALNDADFADIRTMKAFMSGLGWIKTEPDMKSFVNNSFAKKAEALMRR